MTVIERLSQHHLNTSHKVPLTAAMTDYSPYTVSRTGAMNNSGTVFQRELVMMGDYICVQRTIIGQPLKLIKSFCQFEEFGGIPGRIKQTFAFKTANIRLRRVASPGGRSFLPGAFLFAFLYCACFHTVVLSFTCRLCLQQVTFSDKVNLLKPNVVSRFVSSRELNHLAACFIDLPRHLFPPRLFQTQFNVV